MVVGPLNFLLDSGSILGVGPSMGLQSDQSRSLLLGRCSTTFWTLYSVPTTQFGDLNTVKQCVVISSLCGREIIVLFFLGTLNLILWVHKVVFTLTYEETP